MEAFAVGAHPAASLQAPKSHCLPSITLAQLEHQFSSPFCCEIELQIDGMGSDQN
jgi:hypothetical protein